MSKIGKSTEHGRILFLTRPKNDREEKVMTQNESLYLAALDKIAAKLNTIPFENKIEKLRSGFIQLHEAFPSEYPPSLLLDEKELGTWLTEHTDEIATQFITGIQRNNIVTLYRLALPIGVYKTFWTAPVRLVYYCYPEGYCIARLDIIGKKQDENKGEFYARV